MKKSQGNKKSGSYNQGPDNRGSTKLFYEQLCCLILTATQKNNHHVCEMSSTFMPYHAMNEIIQTSFQDTVELRYNEWPRD